MRTIVFGCLTATAALAIALAACKREEPAQNPQGYQQVQPGYAQPAQTGYYQQPQPTAQPQPYPQATVAPQPYPQTAPASVPAAAGTMNPNPTGFACTADGPVCGTHHCNTAAGKCSFPCLSAADCLAGMQCAGQFCIPMLGAPAAK
jgi:hypothetical protein